MTTFCFHIGYHKTGTTWLQNHFFNRHQDIEFMGINQEDQTNDQKWIREVFEFNPFKFEKKSDYIKTRIKNIRKETDKKIIVYSNEGLSGHPWQRGNDSFQFVKNISSVVPDAIIIICIRNQMSAINSFYYQYLIEGGLATQNEFMQKSIEDLSGFFSLEHLKYSRLLELYINQFGKNKVFVFTYEEFLHDSKNFLFKICSSLNINTNIYNPNLNPNIKTNKSLNYRLFPFIRFLNRILPSTKNPYYPKWWPKRKLIEAVLFSVSRKMKKLSNPTNNITDKYFDMFRNSNQWIQTEFSLDLKKYNYPL